MGLFSACWHDIGPQTAAIACMSPLYSYYGDESLAFDEKVGEGQMTGLMYGFLDNNCNKILALEVARSIRCWLHFQINVMHWNDDLCGKIHFTVKLKIFSTLVNAIIIRILDTFYQHPHFHWNQRVVMMPTLSSLVAPRVVITPVLR